MPRWEPGTFEERFWRKVEKSDGCWKWRGYVMKNGYGMYGRARAHEHSQLAHHWAWEFTCGPVPDGLQVLHTCDVRDCVRPDHLFVGTITDNARDKSRKGRHHNQLKTQCPHGHAYSLENTRRYYRKDRDTIGRICKICQHIYYLKKRQR